MKNNKGFTLIELIAVVVILGIISSIAIVGYTGYRAKVNEKEKSTLKQNIMSAFNNYRIKNMVNANEDIDIASFNFESKLSFNGKICKTSSGTIKYVVKKDYDGGNSLEEVYCIKFICDGNEVINNYNNNELYCK